ncbi:MAG: hypothetical protein AAFP76_01565, partial [Bacteroidota bacterium]
MMNFNDYDTKLFLEYFDSKRSGVEKRTKKVLKTSICVKKEGCRNATPFFLNEFQDLSSVVDLLIKIFVFFFNHFTLHLHGRGK